MNSTLKGQKLLKMFSILRYSASKFELAAKSQRLTLFSLNYLLSSDAGISERTYSTESIKENSIEDVSDRYILSTYGKKGFRSSEGLILDHGKGAEIYDTRGNRYLDFAAGIAVSVLGHGDEDVRAAVNDQMSKLIHSSNLYHTQPAVNVAKKLIELSPGFEKVFFTNSGTEANEGALKFAKIYSNISHGIINGSLGRNKMLAFQGSFHGRSLGALSVTYKPKIRDPFAGLTIPTVTHLPLNDIHSLEKFFAENENILSVIVEPVQGEGGINPSNPEFIMKLYDLCRSNDTVLIFDEVQVGFGRAGAGNFWGYQGYQGIIPDILTCAKPIAGGLPMGAILLSESFMNKIGEHVQGEDATVFLGMHGSTFAGNPVCCRAAEVVLAKISKAGFLEHVRDLGKFFIGELENLKSLFPEYIEAINRPIGDEALYAGIKCNIPVDTIISIANEHGLLIISAGDKNDIIRLAPPLVISRDTLTEGLTCLKEVFQKIKDIRTYKTVKNNAIESTEWKNEDEYTEFIKRNSILPDGFEVGSSSFIFYPNEVGGQTEYNMNLNVVKLSSPSTNYAVALTSNKFPGAPIKIARDIVANKKALQAIVINTKISNVHPKEGGLQDAQRICDAVFQECNISDGAAVFPSSTGIIGWRLPVDAIIRELPSCISSSGATNEHGLALAKGIMTTDRYPKASTVELNLTDTATGEVTTIGRITGFAKGAGMIEPRLGLATMLVFLFTDIDPIAFGFKSSLKDILNLAIKRPGSLNSISVDSDQSTSDTVLLISSNCAKPTPEVKLISDVIESKFAEGLSIVCKSLAEHIVRNGEGVEHVVRVLISNCWDYQAALTIGKSIVNSPLIKTAINGNDPNVGRIIVAIGNALSTLKIEANSLDRMRVYIGDILVFENSEFILDGEKETKLTQHIKDAVINCENNPKHPEHSKSVRIEVDFSSGSESAEIIGADLGYGYIDENAVYRS